MRKQRKPAPLKCSILFRNKTLAVRPCYLLPDAVVAPHFVQYSLGLDPLTCDAGEVFRLIRAHTSTLDMSVAIDVRYVATLAVSQELWSRAHQRCKPGGWLVLVHLQNDRRFYSVNGTLVAVEPGDVFFIGCRVGKFFLKKEPIHREPLVLTRKHGPCWDYFAR